MSHLISFYVFCLLLQKKLLFMKVFCFKVNIFKMKNTILKQNIFIIFFLLQSSSLSVFNISYLEIIFKDS